MKRVYQLALFLVVLALAVPVLAQQQHTGVVTDAETGDPLVGANVLIKGQTIGAATDAEGRYSFTYNPVGDYTVVISYLGYRTVEVNSADQDVTNLTVTMEIDPFGLDEVVVTGVASRTAKAVSEVAVSRVDISSFTEKNNYNSIEEMLSGKLAGVEVHKTWGVFGAPMRFNVRSGGGITGNSQPVIYIDGIKMENTEHNAMGANIGVSSLNSLEPEDIANIEVIKGPAGASSYGTGGSNGVVLITTKRGQLGAEGARNWQVNYKGTLGYHDQRKDYDEQDIRTYKTVNSFLKKGTIQKNNISVSGGTSQLRMYAAVDRAFEKGMMRQNNQDLTNMRANIDFFPNDKVNFKVSAGFHTAEIEFPGTQRGGHEWAEVSMNPVPYDVATYNRPTPANYAARQYRNYVNSFTGSATAEFTPFAGIANKWLRGLSGRFTVGIDDRDNRTVINQEVKTVEIHNRTNEGSRAIDQRHGQTLTYTGDVRYNYDFYGIQASATAGAQLFEERSRQFQAEKSKFVTSLISTIEAGDIFQDVEENENNFKSAGIFTEHSFSYQDTYFGSFMVRRDYASVLGTQSSDIIYPRGSFAVRLDKFDAVPSYIRLLKLRTAYGETGILPGRRDGIPVLWEARNSQYGVGADLAAIGNPDLKPERIKEWEIGFDSEFGNFGWEFSYYQQKATDSIVNKSNPPSSGKTASPRKFNVGKIDGSGWESLFQGFWSGRELGGWSVNFTLTNSYNENEVKSLGGGDPIFEGPGGGKQTVSVGLPKNAFYNPKGIKAKISDGTNVMEDELAPNFGEVVPAGEYYGYERSEGRVFEGKGVPDYTGSFGTSLSAYGFTLYGLLEWKLGFVLYNESYIDQLFGGALDNPNYFNGQGGIIWRFDQLVQQLGWGDTGTGATPLTPGTPEYLAVADKYAQTTMWEDANGIQPGDFVKLKELSLTYNAEKLIPKLGLEGYVQGLSIGVGGTNLWLHTKDDFLGLDPELQSFGIQGANGRGIQTFMQSRAIPQDKTIYSFIRLSL